MSASGKTHLSEDVVAGWLERDGKYAGYYTLSVDGKRCVHYSAAHGPTVEGCNDAARSEVAQVRTPEG